MSCPLSYKRFDRHPINIVRDYNKVQGVTHPTDLSLQIIRDVNVRYITLQNSSTNVIAFVILNEESTEFPEDWMILNPSEIRHLAINPHGSDAQYLVLADPMSNPPKIMSSEIYLRSNSNDFVIRAGINKWWVDFFYRPR